MKISQSTECRTFWINKVNYVKSVQCLSKRKKKKKPNIFNRLLQSSVEVKHSPLNSQVALKTNQLFPFPTSWDLLLLVVHRGWALLGIATGVLVGCLDWSPWAGTVWNDWPSVGWGPWSFSGEAAISRGFQRYRSLAILWTIGFCGGFSSLLTSRYRITHLLVLLFLLWNMCGSCRGEVASLWLSRLSPMARSPWRWVRVRRRNIRWAGELLSPAVGVFLQLSRERNNRLLMLSW